MTFDGIPDADHVGIVERVNANSIITIEGNTSASGSQDNGGAVLRKERYYKNIVGAARPKYTQQAKPTTPQEDDTLTQTDFNKMFKIAMDEYLKELKTQSIPNWAKEDGEYAKAVELGITDGSDPCAFIPRYQAAIMALRAVKNK